MLFLWTIISVVFSTNYLYNHASATINTSLRIMVLLPERKGNFYFPFGMERAGAAVSIAIDHLQSQEILNGVNLQVDYVNTKCDDVYALGTSSDRIHQNTYTAIIGPQCSNVCSNVGRLASYFNIPCFSGLCQDTEMLNKSKTFHTLTRFLGTFDKVGLGVHGLMKAFGWNRIGVIVQSHTDRIWLYTGEAINEIIKAKGGMVAISRIYDAKNNITIKTLLQEVAEVSRVIVLAVRGETLRELMLHAHDMGMTNGRYMFVCIYYYLQKNTFGDISWKRNDNSDKKAKEAYKSILFLAYYTPPASQFYEFASEVKNRSKTLFNYQYGSDEEVPYPAVSLYDAAYLYGISVNETLEAGEDHMNGTLVSTRIWGRTFTGITGNITLNKNGDREQGYKIEQISTADDQFNLQVVGFFFSNIGYFQYNDGVSITWPGGKGPIPDHPPCGWNGENCNFGLSDTERLQLVIGSLVGVLILLLSLSIIVPRLVVRKAKARASEMLWRIRENELTFNNRSMKSMSKISLRSGGSQLTTHGHGVVTAYFKGILVCVKKFKNVEHRVDFQELRQLKELEHTNIVKTMGFCVDAPLFFVVTEYCSKGSLMDILENDDINLDMDFKYCLLWDIMKGLEYIFGSSIGYHGNLKSSNCMVDSRFVIKLKDFGPHGWLSMKQRFASDYLWTAPELLRLPKHSSSIVMVATKFITTFAGTAADIYSLGIITHEISERNGPCGIEMLGMTPTEVVDNIQSDTVPTFRPKFEETPPKLQSIIEKCWDEEPSNRPTLKHIMKEINNFTSLRQKGENFFDNLLKRMEQYATNLEDLVEERTSKYFHEKQKAEDLLHRLLPQSIAQQIQSQGYVDPEHYDCVSIMFTDIVQFTTLSAESTPLQIVEMLNSLYSQFDDAINEFDIYKVETIGDAYMCVSGLPTCNDYHHLEICRLAKQMMRISEKFTIPHKPEKKIQIRAGIHSGSCVAGVIGVKMPRYCLFGDTVNTASRMESYGEASKIHVSEKTFQMLTTDLAFTFTPRGDIYIKGKGYMSTYWLEWQDSLRCPSSLYDTTIG